MFIPTTTTTKMALMSEFPNEQHKNEIGYHWKNRILRVKRAQSSLLCQFTFIGHKMVFNSTGVRGKIIFESISVCFFCATVFGAFHFHWQNKDWNQPLLLSDFNSPYNCCSKHLHFIRGTWAKIWHICCGVLVLWCAYISISNACVSTQRRWDFKSFLNYPIGIIQVCVCVYGVELASFLV